MLPHPCARRIPHSADGISQGFGEPYRPQDATAPDKLRDVAFCAAKSGLNAVMLLH